MTVIEVDEGDSCISIVNHIDGVVQQHLTLSGLVNVLKPLFFKDSRQWELLADSRVISCHFELARGPCTFVSCQANTSLSPTNSILQCLANELLARLK